MSTFNILSSCICRDAFGFQERTPHKVVTFLQATSALTWFKYSDKPRRKISANFFNDIESLSNFQKKCLLKDYNKEVLESFTEKTDFFITDMTEFASMNIAKEIFPDGSEHYFTYSKWFQKAYVEGLKKEIFDNKIIRVNHLGVITDEIIDETINQYVKWIISKGYTQEQVILVEDKRAINYTDGNLLYSFAGKENRKIINELLEKIYKAFKKKMPNAHVIKMPIGVLSDTRHKWGLTDLHFCNEYYDYLYKSFDLIATDPECREKISELRDYYSECFFDKKENYMINSFSYVNGPQLIENDLSIENCNEYIIPRGKNFYENKGNQRKGRLAKCFGIIDFEDDYAKIISKNVVYYVKTEDCVKGYLGGNKNVCKKWKTINSSTLVIFNSNSVIIGHNGNGTFGQTQIIQTLTDKEYFIGKTVTFSVEARVLNLNNNGLGGTLGIINSSDYNKGKFYAKTDFVNSNWEKISVSVRMPDIDKFKGVTLCMRAISGTIDNPIHATVEFRNPKFEISSYPTKFV